jgi:nucleosome binding factor SPN SPT16 subunit
MSISYYIGEDQEKEKEKEKEKEQEPPTKKTCCCKKCKQAMKGHPRSHCPTPE